MHNIRTNFRKIYRICKELFEKEVNDRNDFQFYPARPKRSDLQIVALSCLMETLGIDSENLLWSKLKTDYPDLFDTLIDRSRFNRRRRRLVPMIERVQHVAGRLCYGRLIYYRTIEQSTHAINLRHSLQNIPTSYGGGF